MLPKIIAVDFDGVLCENKWPDIGEPNFEIISYLLAEKIKGTKLIFWSCRSKDSLKKALDWCEEKGLTFDAVNENLPEPIEAFGGDTRKIYADEYIDDKMCKRFELPFKPAKSFIYEMKCSPFSNTNVANTEEYYRRIMNALHINDRGL